MNRTTRSGVAAIVCVVLAGCAGPGPRFFPVAPIEVKQLPGGITERWYDRNDAGVGDCCEQLDATGRVTRIGYAHGSEVEYITLSEVPAGEQRHLILLLDSIPYQMVLDAYEAGRFRYCFPPGRTIAPFPVMTDLSFSEFFGNSPSPGIESQYYNGKQLTSGYDTYAAGGNVPWQKYLDYRLNPILHVEAYLDPYPWFDHELRAISRGFLHSGEPRYVGYCVGTSAVGAKYGRNGHQIAIARVDRLCQEVLFSTRGRARFTLLSDHGHAFYEDSVRVPLSDLLKEMGYHSRKSLRWPDDVVVPEFGMVSSAVIHTNRRAEVARDALGMDGVEVVAYMNGDEMIVLDRAGLARVSKKGDRFLCKIEKGDPLELIPVIDTMEQKGQVDDQGYVSDGDLFSATADAPFPDAVERLWRVFHGLVEHTPDVVLSLDQRFYVGDLSMTRLIKLVGVHGSLRQESSSGFAITTQGALPPVERMADLRTSLIQLGVPIGGVENDTSPRALK